MGDKAREAIEVAFLAIALALVLATVLGTACWWEARVR